MELEFHVTQTGWKVGYAHPLQSGFYHCDTGFLDAPEYIAAGSHSRIENRAMAWPNCAYCARGYPS